MDILLVVCSIILTLSAVIRLVSLLHDSKHIDGTLVIDEAADSYTVHITTDPETINHKEYLRLRIEKISTYN